MAGSAYNAALSLRLALRELRHGWKHFSVFLICLMLGVTVIAAVGSIGGLTENALKGEAKSLLGGDFEARLRGVEATPEQVEFLRTYGTLSYVATMRTMLQARGESTLVELKAIDDAYPLAGELLLNENISRKQALADGGVIVDAILLSQLGLALGDEIRLGGESYIIKATLKKEPDRVVQIFSFGPRVMLSHESLRRSGLVNTFSLIEHRYRVLASETSVIDKAFEESLEEILKSRFPDASWRVDISTDGNDTIERFTDQLIAFLLLSGLATFLIAGVGIGGSARAYLEKKVQTIATFKSLGATRHTVFSVYAAVLGMLTLGGGLAGIGIAYIIVRSVLPLIASVLPVLDPQAEIGAAPFALALWYGLLISYLFSMPALLAALNIRPSLLFRSKAGVLLLRSGRGVWLVTIILAALLLVTLLVTARDAVFMLGAVAVMLLAFGLLASCAHLVRRAARRVKVRQPWLRLALGNMYRPGSTSGTVVFAIGISLTVLIALSLTEANFQSRIQRLAKEQAPSLFMIDIQPHEKEELRALLAEYAPAERIMLYPMMRGRIAAINGRPVVESEVDDDVRWAVRGDRGISTSAKPPENAKVIKGEWWPENYAGDPLLSVDKRFLAGMRMNIGDTLTLNILGEEITAKIVNARDIDYTTFQMNFSMMLSPGVIDGFPRTYLSTVYLGEKTEKEAELVRRITRALPGVTVIRTTEVVETVREIVGHIATALRVTVAISLAAGILVLVSALTATIEQRLYDTAVLKVLGARRSDILKACTAEWMLLALATSFIAAAIGTFGAWLISLRFRGQNFSPMPEVTLLAIAACIAVIWVTGYLGNRRLFRLRPAGLLRNE